MKLKKTLDIIICATNKTGHYIVPRLRKHQCDILITHEFNPYGTYTIHKNRYKSVGILSEDTVCLKDILSVGNLYPRKKKKAFKKSILNIIKEI